MVKAKETRDTDGLDASYPQGTFAVQYTEAFKLRREKSVCYFHVYQSALKHFWGGLFVNFCDNWTENV